MICLWYWWQKRQIMMSVCLYMYMYAVICICTSENNLRVSILSFHNMDHRGNWTQVIKPNSVFTEPPQYPLILFSNSSACYDLKTFHEALPLLMISYPRDQLQNRGSNIWQETIKTYHALAISRFFGRKVSIVKLQALQNLCMFVVIRQNNGGVSFMLQRLWYLSAPHPEILCPKSKLNITLEHRITQNFTSFCLVPSILLPGNSTTDFIISCSSSCICHLVKKKSHGYNFMSLVLYLIWYALTSRYYLDAFALVNSINLPLPLPVLGKSVHVFLFNC